MNGNFGEELSLKELSTTRKLQEVQEAGFAAVLDMLQQPDTPAEVRLKAAVFAITLRSASA